MTAEPEWTGRESNPAEYLRLSREQGHAPFDHASKRWATCDGCWTNRRLLDELRNPTGDGHRYGHASEDEIAAQHTSMEESC